MTLFWQDQSGKDWSIDYSPTGERPWVMHSFYWTLEEAQAELARILRRPDRWDTNPFHYRIEGPKEVTCA